MKINSLTALGIGFVFAVSSLAPAAQGAPSEKEVFRWVGTIQDKATSHTTEHDHNLRFTRLDDGEQFQIVDSPELVEKHCKSEKNYVVEVEAIRTPKILFWGGNLVVKNFRVVDASLANPIPHNRPEDVMPSRNYEPARR